MSVEVCPSCRHAWQSHVGGHCACGCIQGMPPPIMDEHICRDGYADWGDGPDCPNCGGKE